MSSGDFYTGGLNQNNMENKENMMQPAVHTYDGGVSEEQITQWKDRYGRVVRIEVEDDGDLHVGYFHRPKLETMAAVNKVAKTDEVKSSQVMFDNCWLGGSDALREDAILFLEATKQLGVMLNSCKSKLKNL